MVGPYFIGLALGGDQTGHFRRMSIGRAVPVRASSNHFFVPGLYMSAVPLTEGSALETIDNETDTVHNQRDFITSKKDAK